MFARGRDVRLSAADRRELLGTADQPVRRLDRHLGDLLNLGRSPRSVKKRIGGLRTGQPGRRRRHAAPYRDTVLRRVAHRRPVIASWRTVHVLDMNPSVTKSQDGSGRIHEDEESVARGDKGVVMTAAQLQIIGRRLPGSSWSGRSGIHIGVEREGDVVGLVTGDAADAVFDIDLDIFEGADGMPDFRGPYVHGRRGERFVYLSWAEVGEDGSVAIFRRLRLHLAPLLEQASAERVLAAKRIQAVLELTDTRGRPLAASVRPPWVTWRLGGPGGR
jgi:hypothetical protein